MNDFFIQAHQLSDIGILALRVAVGIIFIVHGMPKVSQPKMLAEALKVPTWVARLQGLAETLGGVAMIAGLFVRADALIFIIIMLGAIYFKKFVWKIAFMAQQTTGWEFDLLLLASNIALFALGGGALALDRLMVGR